MPAGDYVCGVCKGYLLAGFHDRCQRILAQKRALEQQALFLDPLNIPDEDHPAHELKIWTQYMEDVIKGKKTFELRYNDRHFKEGDFLWLREFDPDSHMILNRAILCEVTYILHGPCHGLMSGYVILGLGPAQNHPHEPMHIKEHL